MSFQTMNKTFALKRNPSPEERVMHGSPEVRSHSLSRVGSSAYYSPYMKSEFGFDGSISRCPVHDPPGNSLYYPTSVGSHHRDFMDWKHVDSRRNSSLDGQSSSLRHRKSSPSPAGNSDLRRKMVFLLHEEIKRSPSTIILEEISDLDRITEMCMATLKSMMESKKYRKYLHHMNNNALPWYSQLLCLDNRHSSVC